MGDNEINKNKLMCTIDYIGQAFGSKDKPAKEDKDQADDGRHGDRLDGNAAAHGLVQINGLFGKSDQDLDRPHGDKYQGKDLDK